MKKQHIYRVIFHNRDKVYELYAKNVHHSAMFGFVEVDKFVFGERTSVVVDPSEENLKSEFKGIQRSYIPMHSIIRIDEVQKRGTAKITEIKAKDGNISPFPVYMRPDNDADLQ